MKASVSQVAVRLRRPFVTATGELPQVELLFLRIEDDEGHAGFGEAACLGSPVDVVRAELEALRPQRPQARAALDMALLDLQGRREGQPVWRLLGAQAALDVEVNYTIATADRAGAAEEGARSARDGFRCVKVKVGLGDDAGRVAAVRAAVGPGAEIRLDANGAWTPAEAVTMLNALEPVGIELCEEPVHGMHGLAEVAGATLVPISMDETASDPGAFERRVCDAVCLKIASFGGLRPVVDAARRARTAGYEIYLASMLDGPLGIAAALHAAAAVQPDRASGLATLGLFEDETPLKPFAGRMTVPGGPGLGDGLIDWYDRE